MPKRKWSNYQNDGYGRSQTRKEVVVETLTQSKKLLHRALKTAKGFERQKLGKRQKIAIEGENFEDVRRINEEIKVLKGLDLDKTTHAHLQKSLFKVKAIAESDLLPDHMKEEIEKEHIGEEERKALHNVMSGLYNMKPVKETMSKIMKEMYDALGIPAAATGRGNKESLKGILKGTVGSHVAELSDELGKNRLKRGEKLEPAWDGFDSETQNLVENSVTGDSDEDENASLESGEDLDEKTISRYDALLGASSDEESFDEETYKGNRPTPPSNRLSLSLSPSSSPSPSLPSLPPPKAPKPTKSKLLVEAPKASTFLPTLMGGYWSGSESSASDIAYEDPAPVRKNRPGQMARRAIYEKKFGERANHIKAGLGPVSQRKDDGWDAKRGAKDSSLRGRGGGRRGGRQREIGKVTGENSAPVGERNRSGGVGKKDDVGVLHPSWQAAKKAKTEEKKATFMGKKVVFD